MRRMLIISILASLLLPLASSAQTVPPTQGSAQDGSPAWYLQGSFPDPGGRTNVDAQGVVTIPPRVPGAGRGAPAPAPLRLYRVAAIPPCAAVAVACSAARCSASLGRQVPGLRYEYLLSLCAAAGRGGRAVGGVGFQRQSVGLPAQGAGVAATL